MKCCGVLNADDWRKNVTNPDWTPATFNKPLGCCNWKKDDKVSVGGLVISNLKRTFHREWTRTFTKYLLRWRRVGLRCTPPTRRKFTISRDACQNSDPR